LRWVKNISGIFAGNISGRIAKIHFATRPSAAVEKKDETAP
jgi:hypothetical protein